jgi:fatty acid desaturase
MLTDTDPVQVADLAMPAMQPAASTPPPALAANLFDPQQVRAALKDLNEPSARIYWSDLLLTALIGWGALAVAIVSPSFSLLMWIASAISACALYRGMIFSHELSHQGPRVLPGLRIAWDLLIGYPMLLPAVMYVGMHSDHHRTQTYGTEQDPEYQPFAGKRGAIMSFIAHTVLLCPLLMLRFFILGPAGLLIPKLHQGLVKYASSLTFNPKYVRIMSPVQTRELKISEVGIPLLWGALAVVLASAGMALGALAVFAGVFTAIAFVNAFRALGAHRYKSDGEPRGKYEQVLDSIDTPGHFLTELWAPVGLRYHALHHLFPNIPYHNMGTLYRRLLSCVPDDGAYRQAISPGLTTSIKELWTGDERS